MIAALELDERDVKAAKHARQSHSHTHTDTRHTGKWLITAFVVGALMNFGTTSAWADPSPGAAAAGAPGSSGSGVKWPAIAPGHYSKQAPPLTGEAKVLTDAKAAKAMAYFQAAQHAWATAGADEAGSTTTTSAPPIHKTLNMPLELQQDPAWCGPANMAMIVKYRGHGFSGTAYQQQQAAANMLNTTEQYGTDYGAMQPALNSRVGQFFYVDVPLPDAPTTTQIQSYEAELVNDVNIGTGWPIAANEYAAPDHWLEYQSQAGGGIIMHWIAAHGYGGSGSETHYQDPGWGQQGVAYYKEQSPYFVVALGGRGYVF